MSASVEINREVPSMAISYAVGPLVSKMTRFDGSTVSYAYNLQGLPSTVSHYPASPLATQPLATSHFAYDLDGLVTNAVLQSRSSPTNNWKLETKNLSYDFASRLTNVAQTFLSVGGATPSPASRTYNSTYTYHPAGQLSQSVTTLSSPSSPSVNWQLTTDYSLDPADRLSSLTSSALATQPLATSHFVAPGQLESHYAPRTPLRCVWKEFVPPSTQRNGWLGLTLPDHPECYAQCEVLSSCGDLREAAAGLFAAMHRLDAAPLDAIYAEMLPDVGLGRAINDRLRRASKR